MIKILSADQIKQLDAFTIRDEPIASIDLMERACKAFVNWFIVRFDVTRKVGIVCGTGNNGGDGLGIARLLNERGYYIQVWIINSGGNQTEDFKVNLKRVKEKVEVGEVTSFDNDLEFSAIDILIDALFGSGLTRPLEGIYAKTVESINRAEALRVAVDIPSGLMADRPSQGPIVKAHVTITFQIPKLAFFLPQSFSFTGEWVTVDIGLKKSFIKSAQTSYRYVIQKDACRISRVRSRFDHKGTFGHALVVAGSYGKMGAAILSTRAALRAGAGLVTVHAPKCGYVIMQASVPEAMMEADHEVDFISQINKSETYSAIGVGPGLGRHPQTVEALGALFAKFRKPLVIDADALNILSEHKEMLENIPEGSILTPHPKEFQRLAGEWINDFERLEKQKELAARLKCIIILKGAFSSIATPQQQVYFNSTGNPGMATGGTGDVLTGILTGLLAQSYSSEEAAILGVYLHGMAGDAVAAERGERGIIASDLIDFLPFAYKKLISG
jgi:NAD(P)H-hydrate epimerase